MRGVHHSPVGEPDDGAGGGPGSAPPPAVPVPEVEAPAVEAPAVAPPADAPPPNPDVSDEELALHLAGGTVLDWKELCAHFGSDTGWLGRDDPAWAGARPAEARIKRLRDIARGGHIAKERRECARRGVRLVSHRHADYPACLLHLHQPPLLLCVRGRWPPPDAALAVVGARAATPYGRHASTLLAGAAARAGHGIVSGLARGIDRHALDAALAEGGWAIAVLGCGLDIAYPSEHRELQELIAQRGTLISEFPLGYKPDRYTFPRRNRIIAALCRQALIVEAGPRSGALITAMHALELGREVLAVPGPMDVETSRGTNQLIFDGAIPALSADLLLFALGRTGPPPPRTATAEREDPLLAALTGRPLSLDELAAAAGEELRVVQSALIALELGGRVERLPGGRWIRRRDVAELR
jgi:DNA processing protein